MSGLVRETLLMLIISPHGIASPNDKARAQLELDRRNKEETDEKDARNFEVSKQVKTATERAAWAAGFSAIAALIAAAATVWQVLNQR